MGKYIVLALAGLAAIGFMVDFVDPEGAAKRQAEDAKRSAEAKVWLDNEVKKRKAEQARQELERRLAVPVRIVN